MLMGRKESEARGAETPERREADATVGRQPPTRLARIQDAHPDRPFNRDAQHAVQAKGTSGRLLDTGLAQHPSANDHDSVVGRLLGSEGQGAGHETAL
jgi:hypothetical protein